MSGTNRDHNYNEPHAMRQIALSHGVASQAICLDGDGHTTFRSLLNTLNNYVPEHLIIVTQKFHLPRALILASALKINAIGVPANNIQFSKSKIFYWSIREIFSIPVNILRLFFYLLFQRKGK